MQKDKRPSTGAILGVGIFSTAAIAVSIAIVLMYS
jgi:hypothetical protein